MISVIREPAIIAGLLPAFDLCPDEYDLMLNGIKNGEISIYQISAENVNALVAGEFVGDSYFIWAMCGRGLIAATNELIPLIKSAGVSEITTSTHKAGVRRIYRLGWGSRITTTFDDDDKTLSYHSMRI